MKPGLPSLSLVLLASLSLLPVSESASGHEARIKRVPIEEVLDLSVGVLDSLPADVVLRNEDEWCAFWDEVHEHRGQPPCDTTLVDFGTEVVLASIGNQAGEGR